MTPFSADLYPVNYKMDKDLLRLLSQANAKYTEYKIKLQTLDFDSKYFLDSILLSESLKSTQIEGTQISQDEMYYLKYMEETDDNKEIQNLKKTVEYAYEKINNGKDIDFELVNTMHRLLLDSVVVLKRSQVIFVQLRIGLVLKVRVLRMRYSFLLHQKMYQVY